MHNSDFWTRITSLYGSQTWNVLLCMQSSVISARITSLYVSQTSSAVLCNQNSDLRTRIEWLYGSPTSPVVLFMQYIVISTINTSPYGSQPSPVGFACKTATSGTSLLGSLTLSAVLCIQKRDFRTRIECLYVSQTSSAVLCIQKSDFMTRIACTNHRWDLGPIETCNSGPILTLWHAKTTDEGWDL